MEAGSEGEINRNTNQSPTEGAKRPRRQMKTPFQLEMLEKTYATEKHPSETTRGVLSEKLGLTDRQLQMWFCHRRLKDKREALCEGTTKARNPGSVGRKGLVESPKEELMTANPVIGTTLDSGSSSDSDSESSQFANGDNSPLVQTRYYESPTTIMERRAITCVEMQLGEPLREDGPILGVEFDELPPGAFGAPIVPSRHRKSYDGKFSTKYDGKRMKASSVDPHEVEEYKSRKDVYGQAAPPCFYHSPVDGASSKSPSLVYGNGYLPKEDVEGQIKTMDIYSPPVRQAWAASSPMNTDVVSHSENNLHKGKKRKSNDAPSEREIQAREKKMRKELEKQDLLRRKREEQMRKEMERQERERRKEELRLMREQQKQEEKFQREERREMERREKFMQRELLREERRKQKEERRMEKEAAKQKAALERATARRMAKESMELIEDERLELMELAASSKGLPSIVSLDYDTLQNLDAFRESLCEFPPKSVQLRMPFALQPWIDSEENVGSLLMVWKFCATFADVIGLWPFTLDEFVQAIHDYESRLLGEIHIAILNLIIKDIEDVVRAPSGGPGTNQYTAINTEGGHPHIIEGAYMWGVDIRNWQKHLNPLTWPEILRQLALSAGLGPQLMQKGIDPVPSSNKDESKSCEDIVSTLRNGSAAENAVALMQEKGLSLQRKSRHRLTPGTVKFAAYHVLAFEGSKGLNVIELAEKIQKSGLRDLTSSKTPEASISVALSRDPVLFERIAPSTYCVRPAFRKDPADAESIIAAAKEKIQRYANGFLSGQNADEEERDEDSDSDVVEATEAERSATPLNTIKNEMIEVGGPYLGNDKEKLPPSVGLENGICSTGIDEGNPDEGIVVDESRSGELWVQGLTEGEYSDLSIKERLNALVALIGIANEGNTIRMILEERMEAANALKKQMLADVQSDKRRMREEFITKICDPSFHTAAEGGSSLQVNKIYDPSGTISGKDDSSVVGGDVNASIDVPAQDTSMGHFVPPSQPSGQMNERSRMQLKSYIGHKAEELYVYRSLPLGQDRRRNRYWYFAASTSCLDPGSGRIFVESPDGRWRLIDSEEGFDGLLTSLDTRGTRESHLHIMLQKIEVCFRECVRRQLSGRQGVAEANSPGYSSPDAPATSISFQIDIGRNETEQSNFLKRYGELQNWMWRECINSTTLRSVAFGKKRCSPVMGVCDVCLTIYDGKQEMCTSCLQHRHTEGNFSKQFWEGEYIILSNSSPVRIRLIKAIFTLLEVSVPHEALDPSWTDEHRKNWGFEIQKCTSVDGLLQMVTMIEAAIKRDYLSEDFETAEDLVHYCNSSRNEFTSAGSVRQLPWIPKTTSAVALRLLELEASIFFTEEQKAAALDEKKLQIIPKFALRYGNTKDIQKAKAMDSDRHGSAKENHAHDAPGSSRGGQGVRKLGGRPFGKSQKVVKRSISQSGGKRGTKNGRTLNQILSQQGVGNAGQKHGRGPRTVRKRRMEKQVVAETPQDYLNDDDEEDKNVLEDAIEDFGADNYVVDNNGSSNSMEADDSDDEHANIDPFAYAKWGAASFDEDDDDNAPNRSDGVMAEMSEDDGDDSEDVENGYDEEDGRNSNGDGGMEIGDGSERDEQNGDEGSDDSMASGDSSD
ncbi:homeobox-DDT domain protein RLT1-like [Andrographis paniculata]|uniref:homeobox-DDT domain protein RLT1-like n=1 Tax=Andrographis paniculata TaxID=175694 RepID=UPI0021E8829C|nr:homeobox-DDT domain protein RLT1-like [Andrographis paniculata]